MANEDIKNLVSGGLIGAILGSWLSKDKEEGAILGAIMGAVFSSTFQANKEAQKTNQSVLIAENGKLYEITPSGEKLFVKNLPESHQNFPPKFKLQ